MNDTFFCADTHIGHAGILKHCKRKWLQPGDLDDRGRWVSDEIRDARVAEMNADIVSDWNSVVGNKDTVYIAGDFAWKDHRKWINVLNGKKILIIGNHDKMPQDALDLFKPDWVCEDVMLRDAVKTLHQFREVHQLLDRVICGQRMTIGHYPMRSWANSVHGSYMVHGHVHGRVQNSLPGYAGHGLIVDVGWDVWKKPISFETLKIEMDRKLSMMDIDFQNHVLRGTRLGRAAIDEVEDD